METKYHGREGFQKALLKTIYWYLKNENKSFFRNNNFIT